MANATPWTDIEGKFCICSICLEQLKEPKLLPCLHRFCKECIKNLFKARYGIFRCPECREGFQIPPNGVDGFQTDFYIKNLVQYVQTQQSRQKDENRKCSSCSNLPSAAAYCFKCNDFLCKDCHQAHMTEKNLNEHKQQTFSLKGIEESTITPEKLVSIRDGPRCHVHRSKLSEICCETCDNLPVCVTCILGKHKGHNLREVAELGGDRRQMLVKELQVLEKTKVRGKVIAPTKVEETLSQNVASEKQKLKEVYESKFQEEEKELELIKIQLENIKDEEKTEKQKILDSLKREMLNEIQKLKDKYEDMCNVKEIEIEGKYKAQVKHLEKRLAKSSQTLERFDQEKKNLFESIEMQQNKQAKNIETILEKYENEHRRFENVNELASSVLASENDWAAIQCTRDICTTATNLLKDLTKDFSELETLTNVNIDYQRHFFGKTLFSKISEKVEEEITIGSEYHYVNGMASSGDGHIVLTGSPHRSFESFIIVIDVHGKIRKQKTIKANIRSSWHACDLLSQGKIASVCQPNEIGLYNVRDGSYIMKNISDVINSWPRGRFVKCVATDPVNNHIFVGGKESRDVYVFDDQLNYLYILTLPEIVKWPRDITVSDSHLLVCDNEGMKSYTTKMQGRAIKVVGQFMKPLDLEGDDWGPWSVSTSKEGFVYMLWKHKKCHKRHLVQYSYDGRQIISTRKVHDKAYVVAAIETSQGEKLMVATQGTQTLYIYDQHDED